jgi:hypothetical protein
MDEDIAPAYTAQEDQGNIVFQKDENLTGDFLNFGYNTQQTIIIE